MGIADIELVNQWAGLVGIDDDHLAGRVGAGEDPHSTAHCVCFLELLWLREQKKEETKMTKRKSTDVFKWSLLPDYCGKRDEEISQKWDVDNVDLLLLNYVSIPDNKNGILDTFLLYSAH